MDDYPTKIEIDRETLLDLLHWARRYADGRRTGVPGEFNRQYRILVKDNPWIADIEPSDAHVCPGFPFANSGSADSFKTI